MNEDFSKALVFTLKEEGGYSNNPNDYGGATNFGITQRVYDSYRNSSRSKLQSVKEITHEEVSDIYYVNYWLIGRCSNMPLPLSTAHFDFCVNSGCGRAMKILIATLDMEVILDESHMKDAIGMLSTIQDINAFTNNYLDARKKYCERIVVLNPSQGVFLHGWENRVEGLRNYLFT